MKNNIKKNVAINIAIGSVILFSGNLFAQSLADQYGVQIIENNTPNIVNYRGIDVPLIANSNNTNNAPNCPKFVIGGSAMSTNCINSSGNYVDSNGNVNNSNSSGNNATGVVAGVIGAGVIGSFADNIGTDAVIENGKQMSDNLTKISAVGVDASIKELDRISDLAALQSSAPQYDLRFGPTPTGDVFAFCSGLRPGKYSPWRYWYDYLCANTQKSYDLR